MLSNRIDRHPGEDVRGTRMNQELAENQFVPQKMLTEGRILLSSSMRGALFCARAQILETEDAK